MFIEKEMQKVPVAAYITFLLLVFATLGMVLFFAVDAFDGSYHDGWRYFLPLIVFDLVFTLVAIIYLFRKKWWQVGYTVLMALPMNNVLSYWPIAIGGFITGCILLAFIIVFRKKLIQ